MNTHALYRSCLVILALGFSVCLLALAFGLILGDPGYRYRPIDASGTPLTQWSQTIEGVALVGVSFDTLSGESRAMYEVELSNNSDNEVEMLGGELSTKGVALKVAVPKDLRRTFPPRSSGEVTLDCDYRGVGRDASVVLGKSIAWTLRLRIGDHIRTVQVKMVR
jgi:hypothetical protein